VIAPLAKIRRVWSAIAVRFRSFWKATIIGVEPAGHWLQERALRVNADVGLGRAKVSRYSLRNLMPAQVRKATIPRVQAGLPLATPASRSLLISGLLRLMCLNHLDAPLTEVRRLERDGPLRALIAGAHRCCLVVASGLSPILLCEVTNTIRAVMNPRCPLSKRSLPVQAVMVRSPQRNHFGFVGARILHDSIA